MIYSSFSLGSLPEIMAATLRVSSWFQQNRAPGGIIDRAVVDGVAPHRCADPQVIPVRAVNDVLVLQFGVAARNHGGHIARLQLPDLRWNVPSYLYAQLDRPEVRPLARLQQVVDIPPGQAQ